jgi:hypothetical protein
MPASFRCGRMDRRSQEVRNRSLRHTTLQKLAGHFELWLRGIHVAYILVWLAYVQHFCGI